MPSSFLAPIQGVFATVFTNKKTALGLLLSACSFSIFASTAPLTLNEAQRLAVERSRQLIAQDHAADASRAMAVAAGQLPDPVLSVGIDSLPVSGPDTLSLTRDFMTMRRIGVMQEITSAEKRRWKAERYRREAEKSIAEKSAATAAIQRDTALAWLNRYYAEAIAAVVAEQGEQARLEIQAAEGAYRSGRGSQAELFAARSELAAVEDRASNVQRLVRNAKASLARWVGTAAEAPLGQEPSIESIRLDQAALDAQLAHHPQIAVLDKQEEIAAAEARLAQANRTSDWSVELAYQQRGPAYSNMISVGVSIPLQWDQKNRQDRELAAKLALVEQASAEREEALRAHIAEIRIMINDWQNGRERQARYEHELIPLAHKQTLASITAYRGGKLSLAEVLAARRNEINIRIQALQLQADTAQLWAQLNYLFPDDDVVPHSTTHLHRD